MNLAGYFTMMETKTRSIPAILRYFLHDSSIQLTKDNYLWDFCKHSVIKKTLDEFSRQTKTFCSVHQIPSFL